MCKPTCSIGLTFLCILMFQSAMLVGQLNFSPTLDVIVEYAEGGEFMNNPLSGGTNRVLFFEVDFNQDQVLELVAVECDSESITIYESNGETSISTFNYKISQLTYEVDFQDFKFWTLFYDVNNDGIIDQLAYKSNFSISQSFEVHYGYYSGGRLSFKELGATLLQKGTLTNELIISANARSFPYFYDYDGDGFLDMFVHKSETASIWYYQYHSQQGDQLVYDLVDECFRDIKIDYSIVPVLSEEQCFNFTSEDSEGSRSHAEDVFFAIDPNIEIESALISNALNDNIAYLSEEAVSYVVQDTFFPNSEYRLTNYPVASFVNASDREEIIISPFDAIDFESKNAVQFLQLDDQEYSFNASKTLDFHSNTIDVGGYSSPTVFDINQDGHDDVLLLSNEINSDFGDGFTELPALIVDTDQESFVLDTVRLPFAFDDNQAQLLFIDVDGDGDQDAIVSRAAGAMDMFENISTGGVLAFQRIANVFSGLGLSKSVVATKVDIDNDGRLDLLVGDRNGRIKYLRNTTVSQQFEFVLEDSFFGEIDIRELGDVLGFSSPLVVVHNGVKHLYIGSRYGNVHHCIIENGVTTDLVKFDYSQGNYNHLAYLEGVNSEGLLISGNISGGVKMLQEDVINTSINDIDAKNDVWIYPNPSTGIINIEGKDMDNSQAYTVETFTVLGVSVSRVSLSSIVNHKLDLSELSEGSYYVAITSAEGKKWTGKVILL